MIKQPDKSTKKFSVLFLIASIVGIVISASLLKEDVMSTAHTLTVYFPVQFGVTPAMTEQGGVFLGIFISIAQVIGAAVWFSKQFSKPIRLMAALIFTLAVPFDAWTDIVFRSGYLQGNLAVATITTVAFYTFGSEIMQTLSLALFVSIWRQGFADMLWGFAYAWNSMGTMKREWGSFFSAAKRVAERESAERVGERNTYQATSRQPVQPEEPRYPAPKPQPMIYPRPAQAQPRPGQSVQPEFRPIRFDDRER